MIHFSEQESVLRDSKPQDGGESKGEVGESKEGANFRSSGRNDVTMTCSYHSAARSC